MALTVSRVPAEPPQPGKLEGRPAEIQSRHGAQYVDFDALYPTYRETQVSPKINADSGARKGRPDPTTIDGKIFADCRRREGCKHARNSAHDSRDERIGIW